MKPFADYHVHPIQKNIIFWIRVVSQCYYTAACTIYVGVIQTTVTVVRIAIPTHDSS